MILDKFKLQNKIAVITGGSGILGSAFVKGMLEAGAKVIVFDLQFENEAAQASDNLHLVKCDITSVNDVKKAFKEVHNIFGKINIIVNNAATKTSNLENFFEDFENYNLETWKEVMSVNVDGMFLVAQEAAKYMKKQDDGGSIIQISSIYGLVAPDSSIYEGAKYLNSNINTPAVYSTSKAAVIGLTKWLAAYLADNKIRVNCIAPGGIQSGQNDDFINKYSKKVPLNRMADVQEIVPLLIYLASEASTYTTGQVFAVDGGFTAW